MAYNKKEQAEHSGKGDFVVRGRVPGNTDVFFFG